MMRRVLCGLLLLVPVLAQAATYTFNVGTINAANPVVSTSVAGSSICSGAWSRSGTSGAFVFTCNGDVSTLSGDVLTISANNVSINVVATSAMALNSTSVGTATRVISVQTSFGNLTATGSNTITGSVVSGSGAINLAGTVVSGSISGTSSTISLTGGSVVGNVTSNGAITTNGTTVGGTLTSNNGTVSLTGGSVAGLVTSGCCSVTSTNTNLSGGARSNSGSLQITGGTIQGPFFAGNNPATFSGVTMTSGSVTGASGITFTNSLVGGASTPVTLTSVSNEITLNNTTVFGNLTAPGFSTVRVNSPSKVYGTCLPNSTPANACITNPATTCFTDNFNRSALGGDWVVSAKVAAHLPTIVSNRMRLTPNAGTVSTVSTLQRLFPAASNFVQVQFRHYAYGGSGADGIAVVLSDASVTPQPGADGGPLGYGTKGGSNVGFAGGWLGVGIDEFGNFSTEGSVSPTPPGPGRRPDSVAIRGSGSGNTGYRYINGTNTPALNPGIDVSGATPGPGFLYRITVDGRDPSKALVTVERDTGSGFVVLPNLNAVNVLAATGQAALPANFFLSLTGSTGGSTNFHELDDLQVCAAEINLIGQQIDHFELSHAGNALTCTPLAVTVKACMDSAVPCTTPYTGTNPPLSAVLSPADWSGLTFSGGVANAQLSVRTAGTVRMSAVSSTPPLKALSQTRCKTGSGAWGTGAACDVVFADSGFIFDVPNLLAGKPQSGITLQAVRKNPTTQICDPAFSSGTRTVQFTRAFSDPASGTQPVQVNGTAVTANTDVSLTFDVNASTSLAVQYADAGQMTLNARYAPTSGLESGLVMTGSDTFVSRPYGLLLETDTSAACTAATIGCPVFPGARAGDPFNLRIKAVAWQSDGEALTAAALADNPVTPNFQLNDIALSSQLLAPAGGSAGTLGVNSYSHVLGTPANSNTTTVTQSISEVGVFSLTATPTTSYFGTTVSGGTSGLVGRFIPKYLSAAGNASLTPSCGSAFSYQGQPMAFATGQDPRLTVTAFNRQGGVTGNYDRGSFWRLSLPGRDAYLSVTGKASLDTPGRLLAQGTLATSQSGADGGDGARTWRWSGEQLLYAPATVPLADDLPFNAAIRQGFSASALTDADGACVGNGSSCQTYSYDFSGSQVRLGRLSIGNAHGSELQPLALPLRLESWQGSSTGLFQLESADTCTSAVLGQPQLGTPTGNLSVGDTTASLSSPALTAAQGVITLTAPGAGNDGSVPVGLPTPTACIAGQANCLPDWLWYDWRGAGREAPQGLATFGVYRGAEPLIFRRELYR